jgi:hypothetical protein
VDAKGRETEMLKGKSHESPKILITKIQRADLLMFAHVFLVKVVWST